MDFQRLGCLPSAHGTLVCPDFPFPCLFSLWGAGMRRRDESSGSRTSLGFLVPVSEESLVG